MWKCKEGAVKAYKEGLQARGDVKRSMFEYFNRSPAPL
jgi:hypothetical protein